MNVWHLGRKCMNLAGRWQWKIAHSPEARAREARPLSIEIGVEKAGAFWHQFPAMMRWICDMRRHLCLTLLLAILPRLAPGADSETRPANVPLRYHCAGLAPLAANTNLATLHKALTLSSAAPVGQLFLSNMSGLLASAWHLEKQPLSSRALEPLVDGLLHTESMGAFGGAQANRLDFVLALRLDEKGPQFWRENAEKAFGKPGEKFAADAFEGWRWQMNPSELFWMIPARDWLLLGRGDDLSPARSEYLRQITSQGRPGAALTDNWLEADVDLPQLAVFLPDWLRLFKPGRVRLNITTESNELSATARILYPQPIAWESRTWQMPEEFLPGRVNSFTAGQGIQAFLNLGPGFSRLDANPLTNQFCLWALGGMPFVTFMAWPAADLTNDLQKLSTEAAAAFNPGLQQINGAKLIWQTNWHRLVLANLRVLMPILEGVQDKSGNFLLMSGFPPPRMKPSAPAEPFRQIGSRTNLVYYDWELTGSRLQDWRLLGRMFLTKQGRLVTEEATKAMHREEVWLLDLYPHWTGDTVTEVTRVAPDELCLTRRAPLGFTGIEIFLLSDWLSMISPSPDADPSPSP